MFSYEKISSFADALRYQMERIPDAQLIHFEGRDSTYRDIHERSNRVANALLAAGLEQQQRIAFIGKNSDIHAVIQMAAAKANLVFVPINNRLAPPEIEYIIDHCDAPILFVGEHYIDAIAAIKHRLKKVKHFIVLSGEYNGYENYQGWHQPNPDNDPLIPVNDSDIVFQLYTSGTTGKPKGVMLSNGGLFPNGGSPPADPETLKGTWMESRPNDISLACMPNFHLSGNAALLTSLRSGGRMVMLAEVNVAKMISTIAEFKIAKIFMVPAVLRMLIDSHLSGTADLSSIRVISYGASPIPVSLLKQCIELFNCSFVQMYGMTEIGASCTMLSPEDHASNNNEKMTSCGKAIAGFEVTIVDPNTRLLLAANNVGEIAIKAPGLMAGYYKNNAATRHSTDNGYYYSGDAGYLDDDGYLYIQDRLKDMIVSGGENVYSVEVEIALDSHPQVKESAVIGVPDVRWGEAVKAVVVLEAQTNINAASLIDYTKQQIAGFKVPKSIEFVTELPRNPAGKVLKKQLREPYWLAHQTRVS